MGFFRFSKDGLLLDTTGKPVHIVGINYITSYICSNFWEDWRPDIIEKDLCRIAELGLSVVRIPMHWGFMEPEEGKYNDSFSEKFHMFVEMCRKYQLYIMPWFLVGVATRDYDVPFRNGRPFFTGEMVSVAENHLKHFIVPYKDEEQILFWDICDEPEFYSRYPNTEQWPYHRGNIARWVKRMYDAIKSVDQNHMVTLGFGSISTENYGMDVRDMADILDLMVVTCYPGWPMPNEGLDTSRKNYCLPFHVKMNTRNKPVFTCEAPGHSSVMYSEEMIGKYFKTSLYSNLLNGSTGVLPWVYNDFDRSIWHETPLEEYLLEPNFGIVTVDGRVKPSGQVLSEFAAFAQNAELGKYRPIKAQVAVVVPEGYYANNKNAVPKVYSAFLLAKGCSVDVDLVWTSEDFSDYKMLILPTVNGILTSQWNRLREYVEQGGTLYHIFENYASLNVYFNELFGVEVQTTEKDYGCTKLVAKNDWGYWASGEEISLTGNGRKELLRVKAENAEVLCTFQDGSPALLKNHYGKGVAYLAALNMDNGLMDVPYQEFLHSESFCIIDTMIQDAGIGRIFRSENVCIEIGCLKDSSTGTILAVCINHDKDEVQTKLHLNRSLLPEQAVVLEYDSGKRVDMEEIEVCFEPAGICIYKIITEKSKSDM